MTMVHYWDVLSRALTGNDGAKISHVLCSSAPEVKSFAGCIPGWKQVVALVSGFSLEELNRRCSLKNRDEVTFDEIGVTRAEV